MPITLLNLGKYMKKLILLSTLLATTALAEDTKFYLKGNLSATHFDSIAKFTTSDKVKRLDQVPIYSMNVGAGVYLARNVRTDITYEQFKAVTHSGITLNRDHKLKGNVQGLSANIYTDLLNTDVVSFFVGAGAGLSNISASHIYTNKVQNAFTRENYKAEPLKSKYKNTLNVSYGLHVGIGARVSPNISTELTYSFKDLGKTKENIHGKLNTVNYKGHYTGVGIRLDI